MLSVAVDDDGGAVVVTKDEEEEDGVPAAAVAAVAAAAAAAAIRCSPSLKFAASRPANNGFSPALFAARTARIVSRVTAGALVSSKAHRQYLSWLMAGSPLQRTLRKQF